MKVIGILVVCLMLACSVAVADQTGTSFWHNHSYTDKDSYEDRYSEFEKKQGIELGIGVDLVLYKNEGKYINRFYIDQVSLQNKWDMNNNDYSLYAVVEVDVYSAVMDYIR